MYAWHMSGMCVLREPEKKLRLQYRSVGAMKVGDMNGLWWCMTNHKTG